MSRLVLELAKLQGDVYENVDMSSGKSPENVYANSGQNDSKSSGNDDEKTQEEKAGPVREINDDGCVYVTVEATGATAAAKKPSKPAKPPKPTHPDSYKDDAVIYSDIDHTKKPPSA